MRQPVLDFRRDHRVDRSHQQAVALHLPQRLRQHFLTDAVDPTSEFGKAQLFAMRELLDKLRGCDLVKMKIGDIVAGGVLRTRATVIQQKTHRPVQFELMTEARKTLLTWLTRRGGTLDDFIFPSRVNYMGHLSTRQYARLVDEWVGAVGLNVAEYGTHSMRRTKASLIYKATGNLRAVQILLGHTNIENTVRYLGVDIDDAITLAERTEI
jgi:integrase